MGSNHSLPLAPSNTSDLSPMFRGSTSASVLKTLTVHRVIGSTKGSNGDQNPYGLALKSYIGYPSGDLKFTDIYPCNFNNKANVQGTGTTLTALVPKPGAKPKTILANKALEGCAADTLDGSNDLWTAAFGAGALTEWIPNKAPVTFKGGLYVRPWAVTFTSSGTLYPTQAIFTADASTGTLILTESCSSGYCQVQNLPVVKGFKVNHGKPGSILGPSGMIFDPYAVNTKLCGPTPCGALYVVDGADNIVYAIYNALNLGHAGCNKPTESCIVVGPTGKTFTGPDKAWIKVIYSGAPLNGPISSTIVYPAANVPGNLVVGNTLDPKGQNLLIELSPAGKVLDVDNVDKGAAGALFGMQAWPLPTQGATKQLFFNDDNANNVQVLEK